MLTAAYPLPWILRRGTPVPLEQYKEKVLYVWFDAPIGYASAPGSG